MISTRFCPICGAANELAGTHCFACGHSLDEKTQEETLLYARYRLGATLGTGGFSAVYHAHDLQTGREVAIKRVTLLGLSAEETIEATDTFNRERDLLSTLHHPQVPRLYDHFHDRDHWYLVLEYLEGTTLEAYLEKRVKRDNLLRLDEVLAIGLQLCVVLEYLHTHQPSVIFRDLKPGNIIRSSKGKLSLIDFGIARYFRKGQARDTRPLGSPGYASPEQYGRAQTTPQSDLYSLGVLLYALLSGQDPAEEPGYNGLVPLPLDGSAGGRQLAELVRRLIAPFPDKRPASASEVAKELEAIRGRSLSHDVSRIWHPPEPQSSLASSADHQRQLQVVQAQFQAQVRASKGASRRRFLRRGLVGGAALIGGGTVFGYLLFSVSNGGYAGRFARSSTSLRPPFRGRSASLISWAPDGEQAVMVAANSSILIYQMGQGATPDFFLGHAGRDEIPLSALTWAPDSKHIAFGSAYGSIILWDVESASSVLTYDSAVGQVNTIAWSPDGAFIASIGAQNRVQISRTGDGRSISSFSGSNTHGPQVLAWSPDSTRMVIASDSSSFQEVVPTLQVWELRTGTLFTFASNPMLAVAWSPDGALIASVDPSGSIFLWQAADGTLVANYATPYGSYVSQSNISLAWSPDSTWLALDSGFDVLQVLNVRTHLSMRKTIHLDERRSMTWQQGKRIALIDESQDIQLIDLQDS